MISKKCLAASALTLTALSGMVIAPAAHATAAQKGVKCDPEKYTHDGDKGGSSGSISLSPPSGINGVASFNAKGEHFRLSVGGGAVYEATLYRKLSNGSTERIKTLEESGAGAKSADLDLGEGTRVFIEIEHQGSCISGTFTA